MLRGFRSLCSSTRRDPSPRLEPVGVLEELAELHRDRRPRAPTAAARDGSPATGPRRRCTPSRCRSSPPSKPDSKTFGTYAADRARSAVCSSAPRCSDVEDLARLLVGADVHDLQRDRLASERVVARQKHRTPCRRGRSAARSCTGRSARRASTSSAVAAPARRAGGQAARASGNTVRVLELRSRLRASSGERLRVHAAKDVALQTPAARPAR